MDDTPRGIVFSAAILAISGLILISTGIILIAYGWNAIPPPGWSADFVLVYAIVSIAVGSIEIISAYGIYKVKFWGWIIAEFSLVVIIAALVDNLGMFLIYILIFIYLLYVRNVFVKTNN